MNQGETSTQFVLEDQNGEEFSLEKLRGKKVLLSFHPLAWTSVCAKQMLSLEENMKEFAKLNTVAVGVSVDTVPSKKAWAKELKIADTRLLCDFWPHGDVAKLYSIFREKNGFSERANIIIDEEGKVIFKKIYPIKQLPDIKEILAELKG